MKIIAIALGTYGDVEPFIILGKALIEKGYKFELIVFKSSLEQALKKGIKATVFPGDCEEVVKSLYASENSGADISNIIMAFYKNIFKNRDIAIKKCMDADLIIYMQFGSFIRHFAEASDIPCIRTSVFPDTKTKLYSVMNPLCKRGSVMCIFQYYLELILLNFITIKQVNTWRKEMGLQKINLFSTDRYSTFGEIPTLYQYSKVLVPPDPKWSKRICITGVWEENDTLTYDVDESLETFLDKDNVIYIGFGSMKPQNMIQIQNIFEKTLDLLDLKAVISLQGANFIKNNNPNIFYIDFVPYDWLFPKIKAVICHGGCGTVHKAMKYGVPTLVMAFGGDQFFWGMQVKERGAGVYPIDMKKDNLEVEMLSHKIKILLGEACRLSAKKIKKALQDEKGTENAVDFIEGYIADIQKKKEERC